MVPCPPPMELSFSGTTKKNKIREKLSNFFLTRSYLQWHNSCEVSQVSTCAVLVGRSNDSHRGHSFLALLSSRDLIDARSREHSLARKHGTLNRRHRFHCQVILLCNRGARIFIEGHLGKASIGSRSHVDHFHGSPFSRPSFLRLGVELGDKHGISGELTNVQVAVLCVETLVSDHEEFSFFFSYQSRGFSSPPWRVPWSNSGPLHIPCSGTRLDSHSPRVGSSPRSLKQRYRLLLAFTREKKKSLSAPFFMSVKLQSF